MNDTSKIFQDIVNMQDELNEKVIPGWREANLNWSNAVLSECNEYLDCFHWKWWKSGPDGAELGEVIDKDNLIVESIDLLHLLISQYLSETKSSNEHLGDLLTSTYKKIQEKNEALTCIGSVSFDIVKTMKVLLSNSIDAQPGYAITALMVILDDLGLSAVDIYEHYLSKNLLNFFRNLNGYKDPNVNYPKYVDGIEDNVIFKNIVSQIIEEMDDPSVEDIRKISFERMRQAIFPN